MKSTLCMIFCHFLENGEKMCWKSKDTYKKLKAAIFHHKQSRKFQQQKTRNGSAIVDLGSDEKYLPEASPTTL